MTARTIPSKCVTALLGVLIAAVVLGVPASASAAAPELHLNSTHQLSSIPAGGVGRYKVEVVNTGSVETSSPVKVNFAVPAGLEIASAIDEIGQEFSEFAAWTCSIAGDSRSATCEGPTFFGFFPISIPAHEPACVAELGTTCNLIFTLRAESGATPGTVHPTITACGGGDTVCPAVADTADDPVDVTGPAKFEVTKFDGTVLQQNGDPATQAGSHPFTASTEFFYTSVLSPGTPLGAPLGEELPFQDLENATVELPPGLVGNPSAYPQCTERQLETSAGSSHAPNCPAESQLGTASLWFDGYIGTPGHPEPLAYPVYNMQAPVGSPAVFGFEVEGAVVHVYVKVRTGEDYGVTVISKNAAEGLPFQGVTFTFWGDPADPEHDAMRSCPSQSFDERGCASTAPLKPFLSLPTSCVGPQQTSLDITGWQGGEASSSFISHDNSGTPIGNDGCNTVDFSPTVEARPTTNVADSPSGLDVDLHIPQNEDPNGSAEANLKDTTVILPEGMAVNPSGANGLGSCSPAQFGLTSAVGATPVHTTADPGTCPDAAKLGSVEVDTPLLDHPMFGSVYIADPYDNPFESLLALYITVDDPQSGVVVKLAGKVEPNPNTGRISATFEENPQLPFEDFKLHFFGGSGGALRTPAVCGKYTTTSSLTPWTAPEGATASPHDDWTITRAPNDSCANSQGTEPNTPSFDAGSVSPIAGAYSPTVIHLRREDGSQQFSSVTVTPPPGLVGKLAGLPACSEGALTSAAAKTGQEELASPSCPAASQVGTVDVAAGAGPAPYNTQGKAYLTGPYKGAPIGLAIVTPATAGPFDLGTVVVRAALNIDPKTAQITAVADPIPSILKGIPLDVRSVAIRLDRPEFTLNPTSCDPTTFTGQLVSTLGQTAALSNRFQLGECSSLGFKPQISLSLTGATKRRGHPALTAVLTPRAGDANIQSVSVALPPNEILDQGHIGTVCTRVDFAASNCPTGSAYGTATVSTPLLGYELSGPVYLRSNPEHELPDLVPDLRGPASQPIRLESAGKTDTFHHGLRNSFEFVPDAPFTRLVLTLPGGSRGLIQNTEDLCAKTQKSTVKFGAHNGLNLESHPVLKVRCPKGTGKKHHRHPHGRHARSGRPLG